MSFSPHTTIHIGTIDTGFGETPIGVNAFGLVLEDGPYDVLEKLGSELAIEWEASVITAMKDGTTAGKCHGVAWQFSPVEPLVRCCQ